MISNSLRERFIRHRWLGQLMVALAFGLGIHAPAMSGISFSKPKAPPLLLPDPMPTAATCDKQGQGQVRAALFGPKDYPALSASMQLAAPQNDVQMMTEALKNLGVKDVDATSGNVSSTVFITKLRTLAATLRCGDTLVLSFHGHAVQLPGAMDRNTLSKAQGMALIFSDAQKFDESTATLAGSVSASELLRYFSELRARGINVTFILDAMYGASLAGNMMYGNPDGAKLWRPQAVNDTETGDTDVGAYAGIYLENAAEMRMPPGAANRKHYGVLTYFLAQSWIAEKGTTSFRATGTELAQKYKDLNISQAGLTLEASHPDRSPLAVGLPGSGRGDVKLRGREDRSIVITNPATQRGATLVSADNLVIEGKVLAPTTPTSISANQIAGKINPDGSFVVRLPVKPGENRIALTAWWGESDFLPKLFTVVASEGSKLVQEGTRYALIIANQDYKDSAFGKLDTPMADAQALAVRLGKKFDFKTSLTSNGQTTSLILLNASKRDMERALSRLRTVMTAADSLVVFYAGHGIYEKETHQAYWLPVDAEANEPQTWLSAHDVRSAIQRLEARHVLVVADSCFSGAFRQRSAEAPAQSGMSRAQFLINSMTRPSRMFISSGDNEPVNDGGGGGHSMFARALIDGLDRQDKPFTAGEIFTQHVKAVVGGKSGQSPQYFPMQEGHDGGEFVFTPVSAMR